MIILSQVFRTHEEGIQEVMRLSPTIGTLFQKYLRPSYKDFSRVLARYIDRQPRPKKAKEPFEEVTMKLVLTPGHLRFMCPAISVEIALEENDWRFTLAGAEVEEALRQRRNVKRAKIMGWEAREEFPED